MKIVLVVALLLLTAFTHLVAGDTEWIHGKILQVKADRLYFDLGEEARVFSGQKYQVVCGSDTVLSGSIENSYDGVSISAPVNPTLNLRRLSACDALLEAAPIDSHAVVRIGSVISPLAMKLSSRYGIASAGERSACRFADLVDTTAHRLGTTDTIVFSSYSDPIAMQIDFENGLLDGCLAYRDLTANGGQHRVTSVPAPYIAVLLPNTASAVTTQGILTTSLAYRMDMSRLPALFDGTGLVPVHTFLAHDSSLPAYPFDPEKGKRLFSDMTAKPKSLTFSTSDKALVRFSNYVADLLARSQCRTVIHEGSSSYDLLVTFVPDTGVDPVGILESIRHRVRPVFDTTQERPEPIRSIDSLLELARSTADASQQRELCETIQRILISDIGCFPLFRPRLYFVSYNHMMGDIFDETGQVDFSKLTKLKAITPDKPR